ncbi:hypothetical protein RRG08_034800 [Elysia crispata]|uniref:Uncharacterized protein n=1 Tax=Elysia crispata TaxID=231223 RepID=A0AAE0YBV8_9GAST|nr:hypothetical protein RRG08_034800 [Elysia crispata]
MSVPLLVPRQTYRTHSSLNLLTGASNEGPFHASPVSQDLKSTTLPRIRFGAEQSPSHSPKMTNESLGLIYARSGDHPPQKPGIGQLAVLEWIDLDIFSLSAGVPPCKPAGLGQSPGLEWKRSFHRGRMEGKQKLLCYARVLSPNMRLRQSKGHEAGICLKILFNISMEFDLFFSLREICLSNTAMLKTDVSRKKHISIDGFGAMTLLLIHAWRLTYLILEFFSKLCRKRACRATEKT